MAVVEGGSLHAAIVVPGPAMSTRGRPGALRLRLKSPRSHPSFPGMIHESGNRILDSLEKQAGWLALPRILRWVAAFQVLTWLLSRFSEPLLGWIDFDCDRILAGEVWRILSWVIYPAARNPLFVLFAAFFMFFINDSLEREWGSFRLTLYVLASTMIIALAGLLPLVGLYGSIFSMLFYSSVFLAFATTFPEENIMLFGIIPIKAKWLGWANALVLFGLVMTTRPQLFTAGVVIIGMLPYLLTFGPSFFANRKRETQAKVRRHRFESAREVSSSFHECVTCGATEHTHPTREFRVAGDGEEYCDSCRQTG